MWRWCSQIASDYMKSSFNPLRLVSAPPPPLTSSAPLFSDQSLIVTLVNLAHGIQGCPKIISLDKNNWHFNFWRSFQSPFSLLLYTRTFLQHPLPKKCTSFFPPVVDPRILFPPSLLVTIFHSFLINVPIIHIEGFWNCIARIRPY